MKLKENVIKNIQMAISLYKSGSYYFKSSYVLLS